VGFPTPFTDSVWLGSDGKRTGEVAAEHRDNGASVFNKESKDSFIAVSGTQGRRLPELNIPARRRCPIAGTDKGRYPLPGSCPGRAVLQRRTHVALP
jgi:hypothetical protein